MGNNTQGTIGQQQDLHFAVDRFPGGLVRRFPHAPQDVAMSSASREPASIALNAPPSFAPSLPLDMQATSDVQAGPDVGSPHQAQSANPVRNSRGVAGMSGSSGISISLPPPTVCRRQRHDLPKHRTAVKATKKRERHSEPTPDDDNDTEYVPPSLCRARAAKPRRSTLSPETQLADVDGKKATTSVHDRPPTLASKVRDDPGTQGHQQTLAVNAAATLPMAAKSGPGTKFSVPQASTPTGIASPVFASGPNPVNTATPASFLSGTLSTTTARELVLSSSSVGPPSTVQVSAANLVSALASPPSPSKKRECKRVHQDELQVATQKRIKLYDERIKMCSEHSDQLKQYSQKLKQLEPQMNHATKELNEAEQKVKETREALQGFEVTMANLLAERKKIETEKERLRLELNDLLQNQQDALAALD